MGGGEWKFSPEKLFVFEKHEDDQMKTVASIHGKTLWTLKNNINYTWLMGMVSQSPYYLASFIKAIEDFKNNPIWSKEYQSSQFKEMIDAHNELLLEETSEH